MFINNFSKYGQIFIIISPIHRKILYVSIIHHKDFHLTCNMSLHYLVKVENSKMLLILTPS